jgi:hypothetical protein
MESASEYTSGLPWGALHRVTNLAIRSMGQLVFGVNTTM